MIERHVREVGAERLRGRILVDQPARRADRRAPTASARCSRRRPAARLRSDPRWCRGEPRNLRDSARAASTSPNRSGCSVSSLAITSSLTQVVPNSSRAIWAVAIASLARTAAGSVGQHAAAELLDQRPEALAGARARRIRGCSETVTISAPDGCDCLLSGISGEGYCAVPSRSREEKLRAVEREHQPPCLGATISISSAASASLVAVRVGRRRRNCR